MRIVAGSVEEAERLKALVVERAASEGKACEIGEFEHHETRPWINIRITLDLKIWLRFAAKVALGIASHVYPPDWRLSSDAQHLRYLMRSEAPCDADGHEISGLYPESMRDGLLGKLAVLPEHLVWFMRGHDNHTRILIMLFGELMVPMTVDTAGRPVPSVAWRLDPCRPRADGQTTWDGLMVELIRRIQLDEVA